jgi:hypothetical protein
MTMIDGGCRTGAYGDIATWHEVERGFWVGSTRGRFLGTIERHGSSRYFARDWARRYVGEYPALDLARTAIMDRAR